MKKYPYPRGELLTPELKKRVKVSVVRSDPDILGGTPVFVGTRVPVQNLIDYLEAGDNLNDFLDAFPSVSREQAIDALEIVREVLLASARPSR